MNPPGTNECVFAFAGTNDAILSEQLLEGHGLAPRVMPLPGAIRAGCGICLRVTVPACRPACRLLEAAGLAFTAYRRRPAHHTYVYEPIAACPEEDDDENT